MGAGDFDQRITIEEQSRVPNGRGGFRRGPWTTIANGNRVPAMVRPLRAEERIAAMQTQAAVTHRVEMRYRDGVKANQRARWHLSDGDRLLYLIGPPLVIGRQRRLRLTVREDVDAAP